MIAIANLFFLISIIIEIEKGHQPFLV